MNSLAPRTAAPPERVRRGDPASAPVAHPARLRPVPFLAEGVERAARGATSADTVDLSLVVRQRRVRFDTEREYVHTASGRIAVGLTLRLFALHDPGAHHVPGCRSCRALALQLRRLASTLLAQANLGADVELGFVAPALYESPTLPGRDEVAMIVRIWPRAASRQVNGSDDACADRLRRGLKQLGVSGA
jgi:hypothetical protein